MSISARLLLAVVTIVFSSGSIAEEAGPAEVMLFGVFHFSNPGRDVVKTEQADVMSPDNQAYLDELARRIGEFNPTRVLLEFDPERDAEMQARYREYLAGSYELKSNEVYQLGFRIAAQSTADTVYGFDETTVHWNAEPLFAYMEEKDTQTGALMQSKIAEITELLGEAHRTKTLRELLLLMNDRNLDRRNRGLYIATNHVGDAENYTGADASASWWHRNFRMYANIQRHAQPGERVLVIAGQGHTAILRQLLADDDARETVDVVPYL